MFRIKLSLIFMLMFLSFRVLGAQVFVSNNQVGLNEDLYLIFETDQDIKSQPDLSSIEENVRILDRQTRQNTNVYNGKMSVKNQLIYRLLPKKTGQIDLGPFSWQGQDLGLVTIMVQKTSDSSADQPFQSGDVFKLEASFPYQKVYEGQTLVYGLTLSENVDLRNISIQPGAFNQTPLTPYEEPIYHSEIQESRRLNQVTQNYLISPVSSGKGRISQAMVTASVLDKKAKITQGDIFDDFFSHSLFNRQATKEVYAQSDEINFSVLPKPVFIKGWWLPAFGAILKEEYHFPQEIKVGAPIEKEIVLTVAGVESSKLPTITLPQSDSFRCYADKESRSQYLKDGVLISEERLTLVIVPLKSGELTIPEITVDWFDVNEGVLKKARLGHKRVDILPDETAVLNQPILTQQNKMPQNDDLKEIVASDSVKSSDKLSDQQQFFKMMRENDLIFYLTCLVGALSGLVIILVCVIIFLMIKVLKKKKALPELYPW